MFIIVFILTLFTLVIVHEWGHYFAAKRFGIKVLEFGFGLPPRAWGKQIGETIWSLNWLPFGGFVRLLGEDEVDKKLLEDKRSFAHQLVWKRIMVVIAGVTMNLILSWVLFYIVIVWGGFKIILPTPEPIVGVGLVAENSPAQRAGLKVGDRIVAINDQKLTNSEDFQAVIKKNLDRSVNLIVAKWDGTNQKQVNLTPRKNPPAGEGAIGIALSPVAIREFNTPLERLFSGPIYSYEFIKVSVPQMGKIISDLSKGNIDRARSQVAGPIGIAAVSGEILSAGWESIIPYIYFTALLSLNLSVVNVLPFPGLDGGRLLFLIIEAVTKKRPSPTLEKWVHSIGLVVLLTLIVAISASDIEKALTGKLLP